MADEIIAYVVISESPWSVCDTCIKSYQLFHAIFVFFKPGSCEKMKFFEEEILKKNKH